ncbi:MAG: cytochrome c [Myxococcota bacterium]
MRQTLAQIIGIWALATLAGCTQATAPTNEIEAFLSDGPEGAEFRRQILETSLVDPDNGYSALRLRHYGHRDRGWDRLPEFNPEVRWITEDDLGTMNPASPNGLEEFARAFDRASFEPTEEHLVELGREAFERFPLGVDPLLEELIATEQSPDRYGVWTDDSGRVGGLLRVRLENTRGQERTYAPTCTTCHARSDDGTLVPGASGVDLDRGRAYRAAFVARGRAPQSVEGFLHWGPGRVDPTPDGMQNPTAITDLRPIRHQRHLNWAASIENSRLALAVRIDTLFITSYDEQLRPPREIPLAIAYYLWSLGEPGNPGNALAEPEGAALFDAQCSSCHRADGSVGDSIALEHIGTEPSVGLSTMRGTGFYRVPTLWGVADRPQLMHDAAVTSLEQMFEPGRLDSVPGHPFGLGLSDEDRAALLRFVRSIGR